MRDLALNGLARQPLLLAPAALGLGLISLMLARGGMPAWGWALVLGAWACAWALVAALAARVGQAGGGGSTHKKNT